MRQCQDYIYPFLRPLVHEMHFPEISFKTPIIEWVSVFGLARVKLSILTEVHNFQTEFISEKFSKISFSFSFLLQNRIYPLISLMCFFVALNAASWPHKRNTIPLGFARSRSLHTTPKIETWSCEPPRPHLWGEFYMFCVQQRGDFDDGRLGFFGRSS